MSCSSLLPSRLSRRGGLPGWSALIALSIILTACGSTSQSTSATATPGTRSVGDIPDTANYLSYQGTGYHLKYVEGWGIQTTSRAGVVISDKDSSETVTLLSSHSSSVPVQAAADQGHLTSTAPRFHLLAKRSIRLAPGVAVLLQYQTLSAQDAVTGKRVPVMVDRYYIPGPRQNAILTLATPLGVDNVDAFRLIAHSFRWA